MRGGYPIGRRQPLLGGGSTASKQGSAPLFRVTPTQLPENDRSNDVDPLGKCHPIGKPPHNCRKSAARRRGLAGRTTPSRRETASPSGNRHSTGPLRPEAPPNGTPPPATRPPPTRATPPPSPCPATHPTQTLAPRKPTPHHTPAPPHNWPTQPHSDNSHSRATNFTSQVIISELFFPSRHPRVKHPGVGRFAG